MEPDGCDVTVGEFLVRAKACLGSAFHGYKGGEFFMSSRTLVHVARYGETSDNRPVGVEDMGDFVALLVAHVEDF